MLPFGQFPANHRLFAELNLPAVRVKGFFARCKQASELGEGGILFVPRNMELGTAPPLLKGGIPFFCLASLFRGPHTGTTSSQEEVHFQLAQTDDVMMSIQINCSREDMGFSLPFALLFLRSPRAQYPFCSGGTDFGLV